MHNNYWQFNAIYLCTMGNGFGIFTLTLFHRILLASSTLIIKHTVNTRANLSMISINIRTQIITIAKTYNIKWLKCKFVTISKNRHKFMVKRFVAKNLSRYSRCTMVNHLRCDDFWRILFYQHHHDHHPHHHHPFFTIIAKCVIFWTMFSSCFSSYSLLL